MKKITCLLAILMLLGGCATPMSSGVTLNRKSLDNICIGMSKGEVFKIMGTAPIMSEGQTVNNPYKTDIVKGADKTYIVFYYVTDVAANDGMINDNELTPLVFLDDKLAGSGWDYMQTIR